MGRKPLGPCISWVPLVFLCRRTRKPCRCLNYQDRFLLLVQQFFKLKSVIKENKSRKQFAFTLWANRCVEKTKLWIKWNSLQMCWFVLHYLTVSCSLSAPCARKVWRLSTNEEESTTWNIHAVPPPWWGNVSRSPAASTVHTSWIDLITLGTMESGSNQLQRSTMRVVWNHSSTIKNPLMHYTIVRTFQLTRCLTISQHPDLSNFLFQHLFPFYQKQTQNKNFQSEIWKVLLWSEATCVQSMHTMIDPCLSRKRSKFLYSLKLDIYTQSIKIFNSFCFRVIIIVSGG